MFGRSMLNILQMGYIVVKSLIVDVIQLPVTFAIARPVLSGEGISKTFYFEQSIKIACTAT